MVKICRDRGTGTGQCRTVVEITILWTLEPHNTIEILFLSTLAAVVLERTQQLLLDSALCYVLTHPSKSLAGVLLLSCSQHTLPLHLPTPRKILEHPMGKRVSILSRWASGCKHPVS